MCNDEREAILLLLDDLCRAAGGGELGVFEELVDCEARAFAPETPVIEGRAAILNGLQRDLLSWRHDLRLDCAEVVVESNWGFCTGTFGLRSVRTDAGTVRYTDGKFVAVVHRNVDRRWRLYRICYNSNLPGST